jgi:hypothetical protein
LDFRGQSIGSFLRPISKAYPFHHPVAVHKRRRAKALVILAQNAISFSQEYPKHCGAVFCQPKYYRCCLALTFSATVPDKLLIVLPFFSIQIAIKNNIDVFYFACVVPIHVFFTEDGNMEKKVFLATWKDIPAQNEVQYTLQNVECNAGQFTS